MAVDAVILAGALAEPEMQPEDEPISRAMLPVAGKSMLQWLVDAMQGSPAIARVIAVGHVDAKGIDQVIEPSGTFLDNIMLGVTAATGERILVSSSDIPFVTPDGVNDFVTRALATDADFCFPIIPKADCMAKYPQLKRTFAKTREGTFTGGNMVLVSRDFMQRNEAIIAEVYEQRKNIMKLAHIIGLGVLIRVFLAQVASPALLPVPLLENTVSKMLGGTVKAVETPYPEIGEDIDKPEDLKIAREILSQRNQG